MPTTRRAFGHVAPAEPLRGVTRKPNIGTLSPRVSFRDLCFHTLDQGQIGSCVAHSICAATAVLDARVGMVADTDSPLALYRATRQHLAIPLDADPGHPITAGLYVAEHVGLYPLARWPNIPQMFNPPVPDDFTAVAHDRRIVTHTPLASDLDTIRWTLHTGYPVLVGLRVFESIDSDATWRTGDIELPGDGESSIGGHAVMLVGYDSATERFTFQNSWGPTFGDGGFGRVPFSYVTNPHLCTERHAVYAVRTYRL